MNCRGVLEKEVKEEWWKEERDRVAGEYRYKREGGGWWSPEKYCGKRTVKEEGDRREEEAREGFEILKFWRKTISRNVCN